MKLNRKIAQFIEIAKSCDIPGLIMSAPGIGKTSTIELYCKLNDINLTTVVASQYAPDDILGIQAVIDNKLTRLEPAWFNSLIEKSKNGKFNLLFLDEITTCNEYLQAPLLNLIFNKSIGLNTLPENTYILAAGNYADCLNNSFEMSQPLVNRFLILNLTPGDINYSELMTDTFDNLNQASQSEISQYFGMSVEHKCDQAIIDNLFNVIAKSPKKPEIEIQNSLETGLTGFISVRSFSYAKRYFTMANDLGLIDENIVPVIADTLGDLKNTSMEELIKDAFVRIKGSNSITSTQIQTLDKDKLIELIDDLIEHPEKAMDGVYKAILKRKDEIDSAKILKLKDAILQSDGSSFN